MSPRSYLVAWAHGVRPAGDGVAVDERASKPSAIKTFTLAEANALVPVLQITFAAIGQIRGEVDEIARAIGDGDRAQALPILRGERPIPDRHRTAVERLARCLAEIAQAIETLSDRGVLVKDLDRGLVDFYSHHVGHPAFLTWQFGEPQVSYWHEIDAPPDRRRPLGGDASAFLQ